MPANSFIVRLTAVVVLALAALLPNGGANANAKQRCPDLTGDGVVDLFDLATIALHWQQPVGHSRVLRRIDLDHSGIIDQGDVDTLAAHWGCGGAA